MANFWDRLSPQQRQLVAIGVPVLAAFALATRSKTAAPVTPAAPSTPATPPTAGSGSSTGISVGQLADWQTAAAQGLQGELTSGMAAQPAQPAQPAPAPSSPVNAVGKFGAQLLGFLSPQVPVTMSNGVLIDTVTGREAYYGPNGEPGGPVTLAGGIPAGASTWTQPDGKLVWYLANNFAYAPSSQRAPDTPPASIAAGV